MASVTARETHQVNAWRLQNLLEAGYILPHAEKLADSETDLREAIGVLASVRQNRQYQPQQASKVAFKIVY